MLNQNEMEAEIRNLINSGTFSRAKLSSMLTEISKETEKKHAPKRSHTPAPPCTEYVEIKRNYTCMHCGERFSSIVRLKKDESVPSMNKQGRVVIITAQSPAEVELATSSCNWCSNYVKRMPRNELEERYMALLAKCAFTINFERPTGDHEVKL